MRLEYTNGVPDREPTAGVLEYYERILPFYEKEQEGLEEERLEFWRETARRERPRRILDVGSGLGRITEVLSREAPTVGIDVSVALLGRALRLGSAARLVAADMRRPCFGARFDLIAASSDPFCHLLHPRDRRAALAAIAQRLTDRGVFVLEGLVRPRGVFAPPLREVRHGSGVLTIEETWRPLPSKALWRAHYRYRDRSDSGEESGAEASFLAHAWEPGGLSPFFSSCGLSIEALWGDFDRRPFREGSRRILVLARRAGDREIRS